METSETRNPHAAAPSGVTAWRDRWWVIFDVRIGVLPLPVYIVLLLVLAAMAAGGKLDADLPTGIALVAVGGFTCAELARRIPWIRHIGATSIFAAFLPSALIYYHLMPVSVQAEGIFALLTVPTEPVSGWAAALGLLVLIAVVLTYSCYRIRTLEIRYTTE